MVPQFSGYSLRSIGIVFPPLRHRSSPPSSYPPRIDHPPWVARFPDTAESENRDPSTRRRFPASAVGPPSAASATTPSVAHPISP
jgi:hypothetical protein